MENFEPNSGNNEFFLNRKKSVVDAPQESQEKTKSVDYSIKQTTKEHLPTGINVFEDSLRAFKPSSTKSMKKRKKRKLGLNGIVRLVAFCLCLGLFAFSITTILSRSSDLAARDEAYAKLDKYFNRSNSAIPSLKAEGNLSSSLDLIAFLGSDGGGLDMLDTETKDYYNQLHESLLALQKDYEDCWALIIVPDSDGEGVVEHPVMKSSNNTKYLYNLYDGTPSSAGSIFADYRLKDNYDINRNVTIYGHCMTNGTMFRWIKLFFDSANRFSKAQELEITVVTADAIYVYDYFSGYRAEGADFIQRYTTEAKWDDYYYYFLRGRRSLNTIKKDVTYSSDSKIITLVTCTNLASKPGERYVLHCILKNRYAF